jgi:hypothetical protein
MGYVRSSNDILRHRAFLAAALARELGTEVQVDESGYYISIINLRICEGSAEDVLAKPRLMRELKERVLANTSTR